MLSLNSNQTARLWQLWLVVLLNECSIVNETVLNHFTFQTSSLYIISLHFSNWNLLILMSVSLHILHCRPFLLSFSNVPVTRIHVFSMPPFSQNQNLFCFTHLTTISLWKVFYDILKPNITRNFLVLFHNSFFSFSILLLFPSLPLSSTPFVCLSFQNFQTITVLGTVPYTRIEWNTIFIFEIFGFTLFFIIIFGRLIIYNKGALQPWSSASFTLLATLFHFFSYPLFTSWFRISSFA